MNGWPSQVELCSKYSNSRKFVGTATSESPRRAIFTSILAGAQTSPISALTERSFQASHVDRRSFLRVLQVCLPFCLFCHRHFSLES